MGAHLGESGRSPFTKQTYRKLVCIVAKAPVSTDRGLRVSPCTLGDLLREPLSEAAQTAREHIQKLESSGALECHEAEHANAPSHCFRVCSASDSLSGHTHLQLENPLEWRVHRSWSPRHPGRVECGNVSLASRCPRTQLLTLLSFQVPFGHQRAKDAKNGRPRNSATRAPGMLCLESVCW